MGNAKAPTKLRAKVGPGLKRARSIFFQRAAAGQTKPLSLSADFFVQSNAARPLFLARPSLLSLLLFLSSLRTSLRRGHVRDLARPALDDQVRGLADRAGLLRVRQRRARVGRLEVDVVVLLVRLFSIFGCDGGERTSSRGAAE